MKRIGIVDGGGVLVEFTHGDVVRLMEACQALDQRKRGTFRPHDDGVPAELKQAQREASAE